MKTFGRKQTYIDRERHPLLYDVASRAEWIREDEFPAAPEWADEHETWLRFVDTKGEFARFVPRLIHSAYQRDRTLSEIGGAYFLETRCGLPILEWEPKGGNGTRGEYLVGSGTDPIFVEVVTGGWQKDIKDAEGTNSARFSLPKYLSGEARSVGNWQVIRTAVANKHKKFSDSRPSLLIIRDDYLIPLEKFLGPDIALYRSGDGSFADRRYERLGAVAIFRCDLFEEGLQYHFSVYDNPNAIHTVKLPESVFRDYPRRDRAL